MSRQEIQTNAGKVTIATMLSLIGVITLAFLFDLGGGTKSLPVVQADTATTTVTVINQPPQWTRIASERYASATNTPTNVGTSTVWDAVGTDANGEDYFLLICIGTSSPAAATAFQNAPPECFGGAGNRLARSATTSSGAEAQAFRTALDADAEFTRWVAWICDANAGVPACNSRATGTSTSPSTVATSSPFVVNHRPYLTADPTNDSPTLPGDITTWTSLGGDNDTIRGGDELRLIICQTNSFDAAIPGCTGGTWGTTTPPVTSNPTATTSIAIPTQDRNYGSYAFLIDEFNLAATSSFGATSTLTVANATSSVSTSTMVLGVGGNLQLTVEQGETPGLRFDFDVTDDNSCLNASSSDEFAGQKVYIFKDGEACSNFADYDPNHCYSSDRPTTTWNIVCTASSTTCSGASDLTQTIECTFPMWYVADPTDLGPFVANEWLASVVAIDDDGGLSATTSLTTADNDFELLQFLAFTATTGPSGAIAYGSHQPGNGNATLSATTTLLATGNVGMDETLSGYAMCPTYPTCSGNGTSTIFVPFQEYALSAVAYGAGTDLATTTGGDPELEINIPKSTSTSTPSEDDTHWGILVPPAITLSGDYFGVNTITGVVAEDGDW